MNLKSVIIPGVLAILLMQIPHASALVLGQADTFEDGTTQNWTVGLLGAPHPSPPVNVPDGGPLGVGDNYLQLASVGGGGAGSRLTALNPVQWAGDYTSLGLTSIGMDLKNLGSTDLDIRLYLANPVGGPPTDGAITSDSFLLPVGGAWTHVEFMIDPLSLTELLGDVNTLLTNVTELRILHNPLDGFPGPPIVAQLGVDNITALSSSAVPEPSTFGLLSLGLVGLFATKNKRRS